MVIIAIDSIETKGNHTHLLKLIKLILKRSFRVKCLNNFLRFMKLKIIYILMFSFAKITFDVRFYAYFVPVRVSFVLVLLLILNPFVNSFIHPNNSIHAFIISFFPQ